MEQPKYELNPLKNPEPLSFHNHLTLWNSYQSAELRAKHALMLCGVFAGVLLVFSVMTSFDDARQQKAVDEANARNAASNTRTLRLIDYLNKINGDTSRTKQIQ